MNNVGQIVWTRMARSARPLGRSQFRPSRAFGACPGYAAPLRFCCGDCAGGAI